VLPLLEDKHNHCLVAGTVIETLSGSKPIELVTLDDYVLTRSGYKHVIFSDITDINRRVIKVTTTAGELICTPDHKVFIGNRGFIRADALRYNDEVIHIGKSSWNQSNTTEKHIGVIQKARMKRTRLISSAHLLAARSHCTDKFGLIITGIYLKAIISIILTRIQPITIYLISNAFLHWNMPKDISGMQDENNSKRNILKRSGHLQRLGMQVRQALKNIEKSALWRIKNLCQFQSCASAVQTCFFPERLGMLISSVQTNASLHGEEDKDSTMRCGNANAVNSSLVTNTVNPRTVRGRVLIITDAGIADKVYDLTVEDAHEFFANGILVHNCIDALRYGCEAARKITEKKEINPDMFRPTASFYPS
jgi:hypothetical protein